MQNVKNELGNKKTQNTENQQWPIIKISTKQELRIQPGKGMRMSERQVLNFDLK